MNTCIFCKQQHERESVEHIVPRTLGNIHYVLPKGVVCESCNNNFGRHEQKVLTSRLFIQERKKYGLVPEERSYDNHEIRADSMRIFLLKMGYEALYKSRNSIWKQKNFDELTQFLLYGAESDIFMDIPAPGGGFRPIPRWLDRFRLRNNRLHLLYREVKGMLIFRFEFGTIQSTIRLC